MWEVEFRGGGGGGGGGGWGGGWGGGSLSVVSSARKGRVIVSGGCCI